MRAPTFVERTGPRTIELSTIRGESWLANRFDRSFCPRPRTLPTGTVVSAGVFVATVLADTEGRPTRVRFEFTRDLDDPHWVFLAPPGAGMGMGMGLVPWRPPRIGGKSFVPLPRDAPVTDVGDGSAARQQ
jgi:hypothetical protein